MLKKSLLIGILMAPSILAKAPELIMRDFAMTVGETVQTNDVNLAAEPNCVYEIDGSFYEFNRLQDNK
jgi:hypothetical protein